MGRGSDVASEHDALYAAARAPFGLVVRGSVRALRAARTSLAEDIALADLAVLGPDESGGVWLVRRSAVREHLIGGPENVS